MKPIRTLFLTLIASFSVCSCGYQPKKDPQPGKETYVLKDIEIKNPQTEYHVNDDFVKPSVLAYYEAPESGIEKSLYVTDDTVFTGFDSSKVGTFEVTATFTDDEVTCSKKYSYTVKENPTLLKIEVIDPKTTYQVGDTFVKPKVEAVYSANLLNGTNRKDVTEKATFTGFDSSKKGTNTVTVSYKEGNVTKTATYECVIEGVSGKTKLEYTYSSYIQNMVYSESSCPSVGTAKLLIIPLWFTDSSNYIGTAYKEKVREDIKNAYFGTESQTGWHSVKTFYEKESYGKLTLNGTVTEWYNSNSPSSYFYDDSDGMQTANYINTLADWYFENNPSDSRKNYDCNGDGYLDGVMCIYGAPNYATTNNNSASNMWAYAFWLQNEQLKNVNNPGMNCFFWASYDFMYGSNTARNRTGNSNYYYGDTSYCSIDTHTYIHEMGHVFGLDDYYDYNGVANPAGGLTMQDYNVCGHDPYSVMALGWVDPYIPQETMEITIKPFQESGDLILLTPSWNSYNSPFDEYILIELYTPTGLNKFDADHSYEGRTKAPSKAGIRVWHVDARIINGRDQFTLNPNDTNKVLHAMSNTYWVEYGDANDYCSSLGKEYADYNILQYIRNDTSSTYKAKELINNSNMFYAGDTFSMSKFKNQFVKGTKLNSNKSLGWSIQVESCSSSEAVIKVVKE